MPDSVQHPGVQRLTPVRLNGRFVNPAHVREDGVQETSGFREFLKWRRERVRPPDSVRVPRVERVPARLDRAPETGVRATWVGHSTVVLQLGGRTYLTDPVWSQRIGFGTVPRRTPPGVPMDALPDVDAVLLSHNHYDHMDAPTLAKLGKDVPVVCPQGVGAWFEKRGWRDVTELSWWEATKLDGHRVTLVPAQHFSGRTAWDRDRTLWGGFVVEADGASAYYAGDSGYCDAFRQVGEAFPGLDLAVLPVGAYLPRWFMSPVHVDPPEAGQAFLDCGARAMLPVHWGTFRLADEPVDAPPHVLRAWWREQGLDEARLLVAALGETVAPPKP